MMKVVKMLMRDNWLHSLRKFYTGIRYPSNRFLIHVTGTRNAQRMRRR